MGINLLFLKILIKTTGTIFAKGENLPHELRNVDANRKFHLKAVTSIYYFD